MTKPLTGKQLKRLESKKKKISALLNIAELNDRDREAHAKMISQKKCNGDVQENGADGCTDEPSPKKRKVDDSIPNIKANDIQNNIVEHVLEAVKTNKMKETPQLAGEELAELRRQLKERYKTIKKSPIFRLRDIGENANLDTSADRRVPLFLADIQHLLMFALLHKNSPFLPSRWCYLGKSGHVTAFNMLFIEGMSLSDYLRSSEKLESLSGRRFPQRVEVVMPAAYNGSLVEELLAVPLSGNQRESLLTTYGTFEAALKASGEVFRVLRAIFPIAEKSSNKQTPQDKQATKDSEAKPLMAEMSVVKAPYTELPPSDTFPRTHLLLSAWQMLEENYPIPINDSLREKYKGFVPTKDVYKEVTPHSPMYGLDCEMCITCTGQSELTRISIVDEKYEKVLDTFVMPYNKITNYVTQYSGITKELLKGVTTRIEDVQKFIRDTLEPDAILVGQSLNFDLCALKMMHPYCIDTSVIFNITGDRYRKSKLKDLSSHFLKESIQMSKKGHCSVEDASASLRLVQLKLSKGIGFGDTVLSSLQTKQDQLEEDHAAQSGKKKAVLQDIGGYATSLFSYIVRSDKSATILGIPPIIEEYLQYLNPKTTFFERADGGAVTDKTSDGCESSGSLNRVTCLITSCNEDTLSEAVHRIRKSTCTVAQLRLSEDERNKLTEGDDELLKRLNEGVEQMNAATPQNGFFMVVLCGQDATSNGACFLRLHSNEIRPFSFQPRPSLTQPSV